MAVRLQARAYALGAVLLWSTVATAFELALDRLAPEQLVTLASLASTLVLLTVVLVTGRARGLMRLSLRDLGGAAFLGLLSPCLYYLVLFEAYARLPAQEAQPLNYTWVVTLAVLSAVLRKRRLGARGLVALVVCWVGVLVIATRGAVLGLRISDPVGAGLALASAVIWAVYWIFATGEQGDPVIRLLLGFVLGTAWSAVPLFLGSGIRGIDGAGILAASYVGTFEMGLTFLLWQKAQRLARSTAEIGTLVFLTPFLSLVFIHFVAGEEIRRSTLIGLSLIVAGILIERSGQGSGEPVSPGAGASGSAASIPVTGRAAGRRRS